MSCAKTVVWPKSIRKKKLKQKTNPTLLTNLHVFKSEKPSQLQAKHDLLKICSDVRKKKLSCAKLVVRTKIIIWNGKKAGTKLEHVSATINSTYIIPRKSKTNRHDNANQTDVTETSNKVPKN